MAEIVKITKNGVIQYPITKPEAVIDENGKNVLQLIRENSGGSSRVEHRTLYSTSGKTEEDFNSLYGDTERQYNIETYNKIIAGENILLNIEGIPTQYSIVNDEILFGTTIPIDDFLISEFGLLNSNGFALGASKYEMATNGMEFYYIALPDENGVLTDEQKENNKKIFNLKYKENLDNVFIVAQGFLVNDYFFNDEDVQLMLRADFGDLIMVVQISIDTEGNLTVNANQILYPTAGNPTAYFAQYQECINISRPLIIKKDSSYCICDITDNNYIDTSIQEEPMWMYEFNYKNRRYRRHHDASNGDLILEIEIYNGSSESIIVYYDNNHKDENKEAYDKIVNSFKNGIVPNVSVLLALNNDIAVFKPSLIAPLGTTPKSIRIHIDINGDHGNDLGFSQCDLESDGTLNVTNAVQIFKPDTELSETSTNSVQNQAITKALNDKQDKIENLENEVITDEEIYAAALTDLDSRFISVNESISTEITTRETLSEEFQTFKTSVTENEEVWATSLTDINDRITANYEHGETTYSTKTEHQTEVETINTSIVENEEVIAATLTDLNSQIASLNAIIAELTIRIETLENA